jgi:hypothetical protein
MNAHNLPIAALGLILATAAAADERPATSAHRSSRGGMCRALARWTVRERARGGEMSPVVSPGASATARSRS